MGAIIFQVLFQVALCSIWFWIGWTSCENHRYALKSKKLLKELKKGKL